MAASELRIPEPMVFDLVRPLGAPRGEFEINTLFEQPLGGPHLTVAWAPEVEVTVADGLGVEFELPFEGVRLEEYKFAVQGTLGKLGGEAGIHGWQTIVRVDREDGSVNADLLHIAGARISPEFSVLLMNGVRRESGVEGSGLALVSNASIFYRQAKHVVFGIESNLKRGGPLADSWLLMPQTHFRIVDDVNLQFGLGVEHRPTYGAHGTAGWRLIREF